jgi:hypothetical protein
MAASNDHPDLSIVDDDFGDPATGRPSKNSTTDPAPSDPGPARHGVPIWIVAVLGLAACGLLVSQYQRAEGLATEVSSLEAELAVVGAKLDAYKVHLVGLRTGINDMSRSLATLQAMAESDPLAPASPGAAVQGDPLPANLPTLAAPDRPTGTNGSTEDASGPFSQR